MKFNIIKATESCLTGRWSHLATIWQRIAESPESPNESLNIVDVWVALDKLTLKKKAKVCLSKNKKVWMWKKA